MKRKEFIKLFGEAPEDVLGNDWENEIKDMKVLKSVEYNVSDNFCKCGNPKMDESDFCKECV